MKTTRIITPLLHAMPSPRFRSARMSRGLALPPRGLLSVWLGVMVIAAAWCPVARGAAISINPTQDNSIYSESNNSNALGALYAGKTNGSGVRRALFQFDIAGSVPAGSVIDSVSLDLTQTKIGPAGTATFELHPLLAAWGEGTSSGTGAGGSPTAGDATWNFRLYNTNSWTSAGGDFGATSGTATFGTSNIVYTFGSQAGLVTDVQNWLDSPGSNFGWILRAANESTTTARELGSSEDAGQEPILTINYTETPEPGSLVLLGVGTLILSSRRRRSQPPNT